MKIFYHRIQRFLLFYQQFFTRHIIFINNSFSKQLALTFDDGPDPVFTGKILDFLSEQKISATFFLSGPALEKAPEIAKRLTNEGHCLGNHGFEHVSPEVLIPDVLISGFEKTDRLIKDVAGVQIVKFYRPPYGKETTAYKRWISRKSVYSVLWSLDSYDYKTEFNTEQRARMMLRDVTNGDIILFHDTKPDTISLLKKVIPVLQERNYRFVKLDERIR